MKLRKKNKETNFAKVHKSMLFNSALSWRAKGLGAILEYYSDNFEVSLVSIELNGKDGIKSIRSAIKELENECYLYRYQLRKQGRFDTYWIFDSEKLELNDINDFIYEHIGEEIELITRNKLLEKLLELNGVSPTDLPSGTTYKNNNYSSNILDEKKYYIFPDGKVEKHARYKMTVREVK